jgi:ABC-type sugar transport system ATPase subunit
MSLGDRVAVMRAGRIQQIATPRQLYQSPANSFVATFVGSPGMDLFPVRLQRDHGKLQLRLGAHTLVVPATGRADPERLAAHGDAPLVAGLRPEAFRLSPDRGGLAATLADVENLGHEQLAYFSAPWTDGRTLVARLYDTGLGAGDVVNLDIDAAQLYFFTAEGEAIY